MDSPEKVLLEAQLKRIVTNLFRSFLVITEDIQQDHLKVLSELNGQFPKEFLSKWNYLDLSRHSRIRKKILDSGNDSIREIQTLLSNFQISIDNNK